MTHEDIISEIGQIKQFLVSAFASLSKIDKDEEEIQLIKNDINDAIKNCNKLIEKSTFVRNE